jgi:hypothetical protein
MGFRSLITRHLLSAKTKFKSSGDKASLSLRLFKKLNKKLDTIARVRDRTIPNAACWRS